MIALRHLRNLWIPLLAMMVLACFSDASAQVRYRVTDLGTQGNDNLGCAMSLNDEGWTEIMAGKFEPGQQDFVPAQPLVGRVLIDVDGFKIDLGTLGGPSSWMMWGEINDFGEVVGYSETAVPDPNGEDVCHLGDHLTCRPFLWQRFQMSALPTLGGNNGQASAINNRGQIVGFAENGAVDPSCPANTTNNRIQLPVLWENGKAQALPTGSDPGGNALWLNDQGQAVGFTGPCGAMNHAVVWENGNVSPLLDYGTGAEAFGNNNRGQIVGFVDSPDNSTLYGALWQNGTLTTLGLLPGDFGGLASGINSKGQVVGSNFDSNFDWSHAFIWQDGVMTDLNKLLPATSNLMATMANKINERGQISGMAIVVSGPDKGNIHAFLATPVDASIGRRLRTSCMNARNPICPRMLTNSFCGDSDSPDWCNKATSELLHHAFQPYAREGARPEVVAWHSGSREYRRDPESGVGIYSRTTRDVWRAIVTLHSTSVLPTLTRCTRTCAPREST